MYDRMCFNVYAHNRDDHSKNFSFLYDEEEMRWIVSPAYDPHTAAHRVESTQPQLAGKGNREENTFPRVAKIAGIDASYAKSRAREIEEVVRVMLGEYL